MAKLKPFLKELTEISKDSPARDAIPVIPAKMVDVEREINELSKIIDKQPKTTPSISFLTLHNTNQK
jgi:hypothetical protein